MGSKASAKHRGIRGFAKTRAFGPALAVSLVAALILTGSFLDRDVNGSVPVQLAPAEAKPLVQVKTFVPTRLLVPSLKISSAVDPIPVKANGELDPPANAQRLGWWEKSAKGSAGQGQIIITGHVIHNNSNTALEDLNKIKKGSLVELKGSKLEKRYRVTEVEKVGQTAVAKRRIELFGQGPGTEGRLVLITCADWDGTEWRSNIFVFADPVHTA